MKRRQIISDLWYQFPNGVSSYSECSQCQTRLARSGFTCSECLTTELGDLIGDSDSATALVRATMEYREIEAKVTKHD